MFKSLLRQYDLKSKIAFVDVGTQTDLTSYKFSRVFKKTVFSNYDESKVNKTYLVHSNDDLSPDYGLNDALQKPDLVQIMLSQMTCIILKTAEKTKTIKVDTQYLMDDEIKLKVSDWPVGRFSLYVGEFQVFPRCNLDLPSYITVSSEDSNSSLDQVFGLVFQSALDTKTLDKGDLIHSTKIQKSSNKYDLNQNEFQPNSFHLKPPHDSKSKVNTCGSCVKLTYDKKTGNDVPLLANENKLINYTYQNLWDKSELNYEETNIAENINKKLASNSFNINEKEIQLVSSEVQTVAHIEPMSVSDEVSISQEEEKNTLCSKLTYSNLVPLETMDNCLESCETNENTDGQMISFENTDNTLKEISEMPPNTLPELMNDNVDEITDEEVPDISNKNGYFEVQSPFANAENDCANHKMSLQRYEHFINAEHIPSSNSNISMGNANKINVSKDQLISRNGKSEKYSSYPVNSIFDNADKSNLHPDACSKIKPNCILSEIPINHEKSSDDYCRSVYETFTRAKSTLLNAIGILDKEMNPLRNELTKLHNELRNINAGEEILLQSMEPHSNVFTDPAELALISTDIHPSHSLESNATHQTFQEPWKHIFSSNALRYTSNEKFYLVSKSNLMHMAKSRRYFEYYQPTTQGPNLVPHHTYFDGRSHYFHQTDSLVCDPDEIFGKSSSLKK